MVSGKIVAIDCFAEGFPQFPTKYAVVVADVIRSATVAATIVESGRKCFFAPSVEAALILARRLDNPLLVGEVGGNMPYGFDLNNSPVEIEQCTDKMRPAVLVSSSGIPLLQTLRENYKVYVACLRNYGATISYLSGNHNHIALLGAPTRGEFREEDKLCCAWIAAGLMKDGYKAKNSKTIEIINRWKDEPAEACAHGKSAEYLQRSGQVRDLEFILNHVNDLHTVLFVRNDEIIKIGRQGLGRT
jgi:2-phosphosulfolactate phosphatase